MRFAPEYVRHVLNENFEDAKQLFLAPLLAIHHAHLAMLAQQGIVSCEDARRLRDALDVVSQIDLRDVQYDGTYEDLKESQVVVLTAGVNSIMVALYFRHD